MKNQHLKYQGPLAEHFTPLGFKEILIDDYSIVFANQQNWCIKVSTERYDDGIYRWVIAPDGAKYFVFTLIETFEEMHGKKVELVKLDDWMRFLRDNQQWVFQVPQPYKMHYERLKQIKDLKCLNEFVVPS